MACDKLGSRSFNPGSNFHGGDDVRAGLTYKVIDRTVRKSGLLLYFDTIKS